MQVEQISVFLENKAGRLAELTSTLSEADISIKALSLADTTDFGIVRLMVSDTEKANIVLKQNGFAVNKTGVVAVGVPDRPGGLHYMLDILLSAGINVEYMYAFVQQSGDNAIMILRFDRTKEALAVLTEANIQVLDRRQLYAL